MSQERPLLETGQCEAHDLVPYQDTVIDARCQQRGRRVYETDGMGHHRTRIACELHAVDYVARPS